ncbi:3-carboxy-cis,cis-muconate cycloisomerase [Haloactinopolyspora alba]|uniref:3-carboxy-cis,cis-muconate cycloisomerase n=1 Tax=Haloactinopolyspora alba TaxID=648780 RepID=A0A2P8EFJ7_9ACTN|nr:lyase family protein [Haloactinopolyspora alba]PSL08230.1 3-carboxy-cis,cis-muconate cycloisomerase [Haloactinopolyspora alba]
MTVSGATPGPFRLLTALYADEPMARIFGEDATVDGWLRAELALCRAEAAVGIVDAEDVQELEKVIADRDLDRASLWAESRNVGYPVLPLVRQLTHPAEGRRPPRVHWGATTQDVMDTGLVLQLVAAGERLDDLLRAFGDAVAALVDRHRDAVMAARTHAQQAVPTTFAVKMAVYLGQITRDRVRLRAARTAVATLSLYGAGGTSAAMGAASPDIRRAMAEDLGLAVDDVPWHVARDRLVEFGTAGATAAGTAGRLGREIVDLSRTEIGEVREVDGHHRGASSTMPQKRNPISSEAMIGFSVHAATLLPGLYRGLEAGHERAAGEWQAEWMVLPDLVCSAASALALAADAARGLQVDDGAMLANMTAEGGLVMAEAYMMRLAPHVGRERAHDIVYAAAAQARAENVTLDDVIDRSGGTADAGPGRLDPREYVGEAESICDRALEAWHDECEARTE